MAEKHLQDQSARDRIETDLTPNLVVLAGAGAGKTHQLIGRMVNCVGTGRIKVERIAAITFTRKAAGEMRGRFFLRLREQLEKVEGKEKENIADALGKIDQCFIGTIHSFCGQLLRERPLEARLSPDFTEVDDREETVLRRQVWDDFVQLCFQEGDPRLQQLEELGLRTEDLHTFFTRRCEFSDLPLKETRVPMPDMAPAVEEAAGFVKRVEAHLPDPLPADPDDFMKKFERARLFLKYCPLRTDRERVELLQLLYSLGGITQKRWEPNKPFAKELSNEIYPDFKENIIGPVLKQWRQYVYGHVIEFIDEAMKHYEKQRHVSGKLTFQDLLLKATALLQDHPEVRRYFKNRYQCLFVDEFQDTDPVQAKMLFYLTGQETEEMDWRKVKPTPGSLFLVGDEKQSIYRFRRADVETFRLASRILKETGGRVEHLDTSFRSLGRLCEWINRAFSPLFERQDELYQAQFAPLFQDRPDGQDDYCVRKIMIQKVKRNNRQEIAIQDAESVAGFIAAALEGNTDFNQSGEGALLDPQSRPGDFMILTYTRKHLPVYAKALETHGIPYDIAGGGRLRESPEVQALVGMLEAIYRPDDSVSLLGYLRGPLVGIGDDELYTFRQAEGRFDYKGRPPEDLPGEQRERFEMAFARLRQAEEWLRTKSPATAFEMIVEELGVAVFAATGEMGSSRAGNLLRLMAMVRQWESLGRHWGQIVEELSLLIEDPEYQVEEMTLESGQEDVVHLMNLHQAKGLQGKVVFLADPYDTTIDDSKADFHVSRMGDAPYLSLPVKRPKGEFYKEIIAEPIGWEEDEEEEERFLAGEKLRLLYVAATRARNLLVVSCYEGNTAKGSWAQLYPFLEDVPELRRHTARKEEQKIGMPDREQLRDDRSRRWQVVKESSYSLHTVTEELFEEDPQNEGKWGRGRDYGSIIHRLFEWAVKGVLPEDEEELIRHLMSKAGLDTELVKEAKAALEGFRSSPLWREIENSDAVYTEVPFAVPEEDEDGHSVLRGIIDLVYRIQGGWKIVDYKTNLAGGDVDSLMEHYTVQVNNYAEKWEDITGEKVIEKGLWLVDDRSLYSF